MTMKKNSSEGLPCTYCSKPALPDTDPPVCEDHKDMRKEGTETDGQATTLKELGV